MRQAPTRATTHWAHTVGTEGTDNQTDRGTLGHCLLYIHRALETNQGEGRVNTKGTDNHTDSGHTHWGTLVCVNCTHKGHRQADRQQAHTVGHTGMCELCTQRAQTIRQTAGTNRGAYWYV